jgi:hypothetical protein
MDNPLAAGFLAQSVVEFTLMLLALIGVVAWGDYLKDTKHAVISHYIYYWFVFTVAVCIVYTWG